VALKKDKPIKKDGRGGARPGAGRKPAAATPHKIALRDKAQEYGSIALAALVQIAKDKDAPPAARVQAANSILDRGYGKPISSHEHDHKGDISLTAKVVLVPKKIAAEVVTRKAEPQEE